MFRQQECLWEEHRVNNFVVKLSGRMPAKSGGGAGRASQQSPVQVTKGRYP